MEAPSTKDHLKIGILEGDDIGHEVVPASVRIAKAAAEATD
jgi:3-isopropylmalate dehydrogenase